MAKLDDLLLKMQEDAINDDYEHAHRDADQILTRLVTLLRDLLPIEQREKVDAILNAYDDVGKWYA